MQKETFKIHERVSMPVSLPEDFAITGGEVRLKEYAPITSLHIHDCVEIGYCHEGSGLYIINNKILPFSAGDVTFITSSNLHFSSNTPGTESKWSWIMLDPARLLLRVIETDDEISYRSFEHFSGDAFQYMFSRREHEDISAIVKKLTKELIAKAGGYKSTVRCLVYELLIKLHRLYPSQPAHHPEEGTATLHRISASLEYIGTHYMHKIPVTVLSKLCHVCVVQYRRLFFQAMGMMPYEYLSQVRIQVARQFLRTTDEPILSIAMQVGFPSLSSFNRQFKKRTGVSPRAWRKGEST